MRVLVLNAGSASLKFDVIESARDATSPSQGRKLVSGTLEKIGGESVLSVLNGKDVFRTEQLTAKDYYEAANQVFAWLKNEHQFDAATLDLVAHRVVHGADRFDKAVLIDDTAIAAIEDLEDLAPLHNQPAVSVIRAARELFGPDQPMVAGFDTVFHRSLPAQAYTYAIPAELSERLRIRRYGFHGLSHQYLSLRYGEITGTPLDQTSIVTLHLEGGSSACAIQNGRSVETSMGFTPLEGLMMGTRSGDIDPALIGFIARKEQLAVDRVEELLNKKSGLLGVSGISADTRDLMKHFDDNPHVQLALDVFCHRVIKYAGAYLSVIGGASAIVFGGGIGEDSPWIRARICRNFEWCGLQLDSALNEKAINCEARITTANSRLHAYVIPTEEGLCLAHHAVRCFDSQSK